MPLETDGDSVSKFLTGSRAIDAAPKCALICFLLSLFSFNFKPLPAPLAAWRQRMVNSTGL